MSGRMDILPKAYCLELEKLRSHVKPLPAETARAVFDVARVLYSGSCERRNTNMAPMIDDIPLFALFGFAVAISLGIYSIGKLVKAAKNFDRLKIGRAEMAGKEKEMAETNEKTILPEELKAQQAVPAATAEERAALQNKLLVQAKKMIPILLGLSKEDPNAWKGQILEQVKKLVKNPGQFSEDFWDSLFGTGAGGISREDDAEKQGKIEFDMDLPDPVRMPASYSVVYHRLNDKKQDVVTLLERDAEGNIHYLDDEKEDVFVRTEDGFHRYPMLAGQKGFGEWDGVSLSARSVRALTEHFWNCADQTFIRWLGVERTEETEYLDRRCSLYHAEPGTITFSYHCDMVIDDETGICLCYTANELLKGAVFDITEDDRIRIGIGDYCIGGAEMSFYCTKFETESVSFALPAVRDTAPVPVLTDTTAGDSEL